ncbi:MAG: thioredoxin domain-containing protein [Bacteroidetes bacterium]|nr:thioredoxin domain-containing protein [Bacteroidota bacterium]
MEKELQKLINETKKDKSYKPRTKHFNPDGTPKYTNCLFLETSHYLLQHAHNPVNWYPWTADVFDKAKELNRPILLSIGYSTCHWCHVMEEESFENEEIAEYLNKNYLAIKVDREERPDLDAVYMNVVTAITGRGGWPMTVWLTAEQKPFYGGTYFPAKKSYQSPGFLDILQSLNGFYHNKASEMKENSESIIQHIKNNSLIPPSENFPDYQTIEKAIAYYKNNADLNHGGQKTAPKFPSHIPKKLLLRAYDKNQDPEILKIVNITLEKMVNGGLYDQIGGGFHRYATDEKWLIPHFEKMLYNNSLLAIDYLEAYQLTKNPPYKKIVEEILKYIKRDMTSEDGVFFAAEDADTLNQEGKLEEGYFYTWEIAEIKNILSPKNAEIFIKYYTMTEAGNFEGRNILNITKSPAKIAKEFNITSQELENIIEETKEILYKKRKEKPAPLLDNKIITSWNALAISAYAKAGFVLNNQDYVKIAEKALSFILDNLFIDQKLYHTYQDGKAKHIAYLDDYAFLIESLLNTYEASHKIQYLEKAIELEEILAQSYEDKIGGFFLNGTENEKLIAQDKPYYDSATPSGNSIHILNLLKLKDFTGSLKYEKRAVKAMEYFAKIMQSSPALVPEMLNALFYYLEENKQIVIAFPETSKKEITKFLNPLREKFIPHKIIMLTEVGEKNNQQIALFKDKVLIDNKVTAYLCVGNTCKLGTVDSQEFLKNF